MADKPKDTSAGKTEERSRGPVTVVKELLAVDLSTAFALGRVPMRAFAQKLAREIRKSLPKDHWLLGDGTETVIALVADRVEKAGKASKSKGFEVTLEATSDFIEAFSQALCGEEDEDGAKPEKVHHQKIPPEYAKVFGETDGAWIKRVFGLTSSTDAGDMPAIEKQVAAEGTVNWMAKQLVLYGPEKTPGPKQPSVPFKERLADVAQTVDEAVDKTLAPVNHEIEQGLKKWEMFNQARKQKLQAKMQARGQQRSSLLGIFAKWLTKP